MGTQSTEETLARAARSILADQPALAGEIKGRAQQLADALVAVIPLRAEAEAALAKALDLAPDSVERWAMAASGQLWSLTDRDRPDAAVLQRIASALSRAWTAEK